MMNDKRGKRLQDICRIFSSIAEDTLVKYSHNFFSAKNPEGTIRYMLHTKQIYKNADGFYALLPETTTDIAGASAFAIYMQMNRDGSFRVSKAKYPYDYLFEIRHKLYLVINYKKEGPYKLNFLLNSYREQAPDDLSPMPLIILVNANADHIDSRLLPERFMLAIAGFENMKFTQIRFFRKESAEKPLEPDYSFNDEGGIQYDWE